MEFEQIYNTYFDSVEHYLLALCKDAALAEELTAQTFFNVLNNIHTFRGQCDIRTWLFAVAKNCYLSYLRKEKRHVDIDAIPVADDSASLEQRLSDSQTAMQIHRILHALSEPYKEVFSLRVFGQLSFKEIGALFGKSQNWACVTYHRARQKIMSEMEES